MIRLPLLPEEGGGGENQHPFQAGTHEGYFRGLYSLHIKVGIKIKMPGTHKSYRSTAQI